jgi:hypothetical protein
MDIKSAQAENRRSFVGGGPGVVVSGLVWLAAAVTLQQAGVKPGFAALFFGGMLIAPVSTAVVRAIFRRAAPARENALAAIGFETVFSLIASLLAAWLLMASAPDFVFPVAAMAIGARYFTFATLYGSKLYYALGGAIAAIGTAAIWGPVAVPGGVAFAVAAVELAAGVLLTIVFLRAK